MSSSLSGLGEASKPKLLDQIWQLMRLRHYGAGRRFDSKPSAQCAVVLYKEVLQLELGFISEAVRVKRPAKLPVVLSRAEVRAELEQLPGQYRLMGQLLYGSGARRIDAVARGKASPGLAMETMVVNPYR